MRNHDDDVQVSMSAGSRWRRENGGTLLYIGGVLIIGLVLLAALIPYYQEKGRNHDLTRQLAQVRKDARDNGKEIAALRQDVEDGREEIARLTDLVVALGGDPGPASTGSGSEPTLTPQEEAADCTVNLLLVVVCPNDG